MDYIGAEATRGATYRRTARGGDSRDMLTREYRHAVAFGRAEIAEVKRRANRTERRAVRASLAIRWAD